MHERCAIIDIGSNTVRLVIYGGPLRAPVVLLNEKVSAKLGKDIARTGRMSDKAIASALTGLGRYAAILRIMAVTDIQTVATAASREASNGAQFLDAVRGLGLHPRLLTGEEEASTSAMGVIGAFPGAHGVVADLGGGSLELVRIAGDTCEHGISVPFGSLRLPELRAEGERKFAERVGRALREAGWRDGRDQPLYLVGGSWRAMARYALHLEAQAHASPLDDPHGLEIEPDAALRIARRLSRSTQLPELEGIAGPRLTSLPDAAGLLVELIRHINPSQLVCSSWGLREGLLFATLDPATRAIDPLIAAIGAFAQRYGVSAEDAALVARWTAPVCETLETRDATGSRRERLRQGATLLALAAMRIEPNLRTLEALAWALRKRWVGLDKHGRAVLAATIIANGGKTELPADIAILAADADLHAAIAWGLAIRLCRKLTACAAPALVGSRLAVERGRLILDLFPPAVALYTDPIAKDLRLLADWLSLEPEVRRITDPALSDAA